MTSTISEPGVSHGTRDSWRPHDGGRYDTDQKDQSRQADPHGNDPHGADRHGTKRGRAGHRAAERRRLRLPAGDKVRVPQPSVPLVPRSRVTDLIERASAQHRVTLVCGPSGAGKTIACAQWAAAAADSTGWLSLDYGDRWPRRLWVHVKSALASIPAMPAQIARDLPDPCDDAFPLQLAQVAQRLTTPVTLVLDDICELAGATVLASVDQLIKHAPPTLRLVLSGRHPAGLQVARLRVGGELAEIGASELACTPDEAAAYFRMLGLDLPAAECDELLRRTEGWITGLRLAAMRAGSAKPAASVSRITGDEPAVADYLWDEVLASLPADRRMFLLRTSVADIVCGELADTLTGGSGSGSILDQLSRENLMVRPADTELARTERTQYRYHPMLLDMLRARLRRELPAETARLTRRAARWLAANGRPAEAIRNAARAADWDFAGRVLADVGPAMLMPGPAAELEPVLAAFPATRYTSDAAVAGALAAAGLRTGDTCAAALHLGNAQDALARCGHAQRERIRTWLQALRLMSAGQGSGATDDLVDQSRAIAVQAELGATGPAEHQGLGLLWCALGVAEFAGMDAAGARESFASARRHLRDGQPGFFDLARMWQALAEAVSGDLLTAGELLAAAKISETNRADGTNETDETDETDRADGNSLTRELASLTAAYIHLARDEPAAARVALDRSEPSGPGTESSLTRFDAGRRDAATPATDPQAARVIFSLASAARAQLALADGDLGTARGALTRLRYQCLNSRAGRYRGRSQPRADLPQADEPQAANKALETLLAPLEADIAVRDGDFSRARLALAQAGQDRATASSAVLLAQARLLLAQGDNQGTLAAIDPCLDPATSRVTLHDHVCALVTACIAARRLGQAEQAAEQLACALALAEPQRMYRPFLDGGAAARSALTVLIRPVSQGAAFAARILQRFDTAPASAPGQPPVTCVPLTGSEIAVLRFLPSHMTNQEIAEALFLSINTVKTHLRSVYRKLGVATRRQAIARGGKLGLL
jgi:LuxR family maltose regulon positive regulatory protein